MKKWKVVVGNARDSVSVYLEKSPIMQSFHTVHPPNFFERLFGVTYQEKILKKIRHLQKEGEKLNYIEELTRRAVKDVKEAIDVAQKAMNLMDRTLIGAMEELREAWRDLVRAFIEETVFGRAANRMAWGIIEFLRRHTSD